MPLQQSQYSHISGKVFRMVVLCMRGCKAPWPCQVLDHTLHGAHVAIQIGNDSRSWDTGACPEVAVVDLFEEALDAVVAAAVVQQQELHLGGRHKRRHL